MHHSKNEMVQMHVLKGLNQFRQNDDVCVQQYHFTNEYEGMRHDERCQYQQRTCLVYDTHHPSHFEHV
jgi:hypothetical protein